MHISLYIQQKLSYISLQIRNFIIDMLYVSLWETFLESHPDAHVLEY